MSAAIKMEYILEQITKLDYDSKIQVVEKILTMLKSEKKDSSTKRSIVELRGLGADVWKDIDVEAYLKNEREWK